ncbi:hypothetical protein C8R45DRAFT_401829 [Mycena sanguinolenta]|nr:hypothetical protein C8R45DRAFT_401829 [Mycena sanguinolenta]
MRRVRRRTSSSTPAPAPAPPRPTWQRCTERSTTAMGARWSIPTPLYLFVDGSRAPPTSKSARSEAPWQLRRLLDVPFPTQTGLAPSAADAYSATSSVCPSPRPLCRRRHTSTRHCAAAPDAPRTASPSPTSLPCSRTTSSGILRRGASGSWTASTSTSCRARSSASTFTAFVFYFHCSCCTALLVRACDFSCPPSSPLRLLYAERPLVVWHRRERKAHMEQPRCRFFSDRGYEGRVVNDLDVCTDLDGLSP